ncbi:ABC transporter permease subunit [Glaciihabitans sp. INWT7]|uniref:ABC transporter permease n=1 Tax=Glaciihabitans sp. INWT7 TaxID=2596912 RepID=UPI00162AB95F|nr:ABC transporter permease subunit [Glaciihabitans sp. INWT7]QNE47068.1 ABC transporter permease subunit [Glaciihabitans sp. INWT7]
MNWLLNNGELIGQLVVAHLLIAIPPIILSFVISVPIGWVANRYRWSRGTLLTVLGLLYAIPSLPLFIILPLIIGTGLRDPVNLVVALTLYGIALMVRTTADGLGSVDPDIRQSATAVGFSARSQFFRVELPLAGPVLLAGIRVVAVSTISLTTVGAVIGISSLGALFTDGIQRGIAVEILTGIVLTIVIALGVDGLLVLLGRVLMPWVAVTSGRVPRRDRRRSREAVTA